MPSAPLTATIPVKRAQKSTKETRLEALTAAEEEERKRLAAPFSVNYRKGHFKIPIPNPIHRNPYYLYFQSSEGDEAAARKLLPDLNPQSPTRKKPDVDLTVLKPKCAELYVKLEKLYGKMAKEDKEFDDFRRDFLDREKKRKLKVDK